MTAVLHDPGWLRHRVTIEAATPTPDDAGGATLTWAEVATVWARIEPVGASERAIAGHIAAEVTHRITLRWREGIAGGMRVAWRGRTFRILSAIDADETRRYLVATAGEETP